MLDDVGPTYFLEKMLDESLKQFKHSSNILFLISEVMLDAFARSPNMLDQHSCKNNVDFIETQTF